MTSFEFRAPTLPRLPILLCPWRLINAEFRVPCTNLGLYIYWDRRRFGGWHIDQGDSGQFQVGRLSIVWCFEPPPPCAGADDAETWALEAG
jgi:hypothetical protein